MFAELNYCYSDKTAIDWFKNKQPLIEIEQMVKGLSPPQLKLVRVGKEVDKIIATNFSISDMYPIINIK